MGLPQPDRDDWVCPLVREYLQTAASGFPYIDCPDDLRPPGSFPDSWWVIYAPNHNGGFIVEGYLIEQWGERQRKFLFFWSALGLFLFYLFIFSSWWLVLVIVLPAWLALAPAASWFLGRSTFAKREWIEFPQPLRDALQNGVALLAKRQAEEHRKQALSEAVSQIAGKFGGVFVEGIVGKAAGSLSEVAIEKALKGLAERLVEAKE